MSSISKKVNEMSMFKTFFENGCSPPLIRNVKDASVLVLVPGSEFEMGDGKEVDCPKHLVHVDAYYIGIYCVTNAQYARFVRDGNGRAPENLKWKDTALFGHPVVNVSWDDAAAYAEWVGCSLPTEAQWEKAARGPKSLIYPWGNEWDVAKCRNEKNKGKGQTCEVWDYPAGTSNYGTMNQSGNVWEWCSDWYGDTHYSEPDATKKPVGPATGLYRVNHGASWRNAAASNFRGAYRGWYHPSVHLGYQGFRLVRSASEGFPESSVNKRK